MRFGLAIVAGAIVCCAFIAAHLALRYWGGVGVFTADDWMALAPDLRGWLIDYALGLGLGVGLWAVLRAEQRGGLWLAAGIGAFAMVIAPQINPVIYILQLGIPIDWGLTLQGAVRRACLPLAAGAVAGAAMWRIAYGGAARLADSESSGGDVMKVGFGVALMALALGVTPASAQTATGFAPSVESSIQSVLPRMIAWRRDFHEHPELSYEEVRTARVVAAHLRSLRMEVRTGVAQTGVVGVLRGGRPGPVIALRADMDALPVTEEGDLPFRSRARGRYNGQDVGIMHACGHDTHVAVLMAAATVLASRRAELAGTVIFVFQPSEEGAPPGGLGGARRMLAENVFGDLRPQAMFGLHAWPGPSGTVTMISGPMMAGSDRIDITVTGSQTHGAQPHAGIDPIVASAQIINALQTVPSRQMDAVNSPVIVTIGLIQGGVRYNIIPQTVQMQGTLRYLNPETREDFYESIRRTVGQTVGAMGATAEVTITENAIPTVNPPALYARARAAAVRALGEDAVLSGSPVMPAEDFAYFQREVPGFFFFYGVNPPGVTTAEAAPNHNPRFFVHEPSMETALRAMLAVALDRVGGEQT